MPSDFVTVLKNYQKKLTNITGSNKSLVHLRLTKSQDIDLDKLDYLNNYSSSEILNKIITRQKAYICPVVDPRDEKSNEASAHLRKIYKKDNFLFEERGAKDLYLGWPYVEGKFNTGNIVRCPLLYFPVELIEQNNNWYLTFRKDVNISFNKTFLLAYAHFNGVQFDEEFLNHSFNDFSKNLQEFKNQLYEFLKNSNLDVNFNQDLFKSQLNKFTDYRKVDFDIQQDNGKLKLQPYAVVGIFSQADSYLLPDYDTIIRQAKYENFEELFIKKSHAEGEELNFSFDYLTKVKEDTLITPLPLDIAQENALKAVKSGHSIVVQGPPGTGKSQLLCNTISDFIARGKRVLVVCQKRAALDVIHKRLTEINIGSFITLVHDHNADRKEIYDKLADQINALDNYERQNNSLDTIYLEREFLQAARKIDANVDELNDLKTALFNDEEFGLPIKQLYLTTQPEKEFIDFKLLYKHFKNNEEERFYDLLNDLAVFEKKIHPEHIWSVRKSFSDFESLDKDRIKYSIKEIFSQSQHFTNSIKENFGSVLNSKDAFNLACRVQILKDGLDILKENNVFNLFQQIIQHQPDKKWLLVQEERINNLFRDHGIDKSTPQPELGPLSESLNQTLKSFKNPFYRIYWRLFVPKTSEVKRALVNNNLDFSSKDLKKLVIRLNNRMNLEHLLTEINQTSWTPNINKHNREYLKKWFHDTFIALEVLEIVDSFRAHFDFFKVKENTLSEVYSNIQKFEEIVNSFKSLYNDWRIHLLGSQISILQENEALANDYSQSIDQDFDNLVALDKIKSKMDNVEVEVYNLLVDYKEKAEVFKYSNRKQWINYIETKYPVLKIVSSEEITLLIQTLERSIKKKKEHTLKILLLKLREQTYRNIEYNRLNNRVTYRDLEHQLTKKRRVWPLRKLLAEYSNEVFQLSPCWLASPESVSSIFPMNEVFDLVIFDEASQCFAEKSLPSLQRAKQVMITGDEHQLRPNNLYQVRWEDDENDKEAPIELEKESLLDLGSQHLKQVMLTNHYRSEHNELIFFSNRHFYKNQLEYIPSISEQNKTAIFSHYSPEGIWDKNTNPTEARYILKKIEELLDEGVTSIGVITFNQKQQELIDSMLFDWSKDQNIILPSELFVKNIENVQGDERDYILFSIGYAKNSAGRLIMNFGSLNQHGGENRLNVAITRAKKEIHLFSSILPNDIDSESLKNKGPKLLKSYLEYCFSKRTTSELSANDIPANSLISKIEQTDPGYSTTYFGDLVRGNQVLFTDDNFYFQSKSGKDFFYYKPRRLRKKEWEVDFIFSRNYKEEH